MGHGCSCCCRCRCLLLTRDKLTLHRAIGGRATQFPDVETYRRVQVDFTLAAARAFRETLVPQLPAGKQFRFVFCSGKFAEWDQKKPLSFLADTRRVKVRFFFLGTHTQRPRKKKKILTLCAK